MTSAPSSNGKPPTSIREAAAYYMSAGLAVIPVPFRTKIAIIEGWPDLRLKPDALDEYFPLGKPTNLGVVLGAASNRLVDVDLDCAEAVAVADVLLPPTGRIFGRRGNPHSHRLYRCTGAAAKSKKYTDIDVRDTDGKVVKGKSLIELRADGCMTVFPPSVHESDESIFWDSFETAGEPLTDDLATAVEKVAAAALLARHWPNKGSRHDSRLDLAGGLLRAGWTDDDATTFITAVCTASHCTGITDCAKVVRDTRERIQHDEDVKGWPSLAKIVGDEVVSEAMKWLGIRGKTPADAADIPLPVEAPWPDPPAEEAYYGLAGRIVRAIEPQTEADPAALLVQVLVAFGNNIGRVAHFDVEADRHHANEFAVIVGKTSKARERERAGVGLIGSFVWSRSNGPSTASNPAYRAAKVLSGLSAIPSPSARRSIMGKERRPLTKRSRPIPASPTNGCKSWSRSLPTF